jgi:hypothetical protein
LSDAIGQTLRHIPGASISSSGMRQDEEPPRDQPESRFDEEQHDEPERARDEAKPARTACQNHSGNGCRISR